MWGSNTQLFVPVDNNGPLPIVQEVVLPPVVQIKEPVGGERSPHSGQDSNLKLGDLDAESGYGCEADFENDDDDYQLVSYAAQNYARKIEVFEDSDLVAFLTTHQLLKFIPILQTYNTNPQQLGKINTVAQLGALPHETIRHFFNQKVGNQKEEIPTSEEIERLIKIIEK